MKIKINQELCLGCGFCVSSYPKLFEFHGDAIYINQDIETPKDIQKAIDGCVSKAILVVDEN